MDKKLGKFHSIKIRDYFKNEATDFTPWLAEKDNINILGDTLGLDLEVTEVEAKVGKFSADIIANDSYSDRSIVIENQLTKSDHDHLGKILTYSAGYNAGIMIWIAEKIQDEHKEAISYLNKISSDEYSFFGIEIELWKIDDSSAAPKFNIVIAPNEWSKSINSKSNKSRTNEINDTKKIQKEFWEGYVDYLNDNDSMFRHGKPMHRSWFNFYFPYPKIHFTQVLRKDYITCGLYIKGSVDGTGILFEQIENYNKEIDDKFSNALEWRKKVNLKNSDIRLVKLNTDYKNISNWSSYYEWFYTNATNFYDTFPKFLDKLNISE